MESVITGCAVGLVVLLVGRWVDRDAKLDQETLELKLGSIKDSVNTAKTALSNIEKGLEGISNQLGKLRVEVAVLQTQTNHNSKRIDIFDQTLSKLVSDSSN